MRRRAIGSVLLAFMLGLSLAAAATASAFGFMPRTDGGGQCDVTTTSHPTVYGFVVEDCTMKITDVRGVGELYCGGTLIDEHHFGAPSAPFAVMMRYTPVDESAPQEGDRTRIRFQLRLSRGGKREKWMKPGRAAGYTCAVLRGTRPRQVLRCTVREATS
ncbi:MAG: hypothetical protein KDB94_10935 [Acidobacteria bacterium]|nr:hypothetical protein [Acidobacteriota bacterium]